MIEIIAPDSWPDIALNALKRAVPKRIGVRYISSPGPDFGRVVQITLCRNERKRSMTAGRTKSKSACPSPRRRTTKRDPGGRVHGKAPFRLGEVTGGHGARLRQDTLQNSRGRIHNQAGQSIFPGGEIPIPATVLRSRPPQML